MNTEIFCFSAFFLGLSIGLLNSNLSKPAAKPKRRKKKKKAAKAEVSLYDFPESKPKSKPENVQESIELLKEIYQDDMVILSGLGEIKFKVFLHPNLKIRDIRCSLYLCVALPKRYPQLLPILDIQDPVGIETSVFEVLKIEMQKKLKEISCQQKPIVFEVAYWLKEQLFKLNPTPPPSPLITQSKLEQSVKEESFEDSGLDIEKQVQEELEKRGHATNPGEPILLNSITNIKNIDKELSESPLRVPQSITGFDFKSSFDHKELIGKGGGGSVYKVTNRLDECVYAVKVINLKGLKSSSPILKEVVVFSRLQHQNIVRYHNAWVEDNSDSEESDKSPEDSYESSSYSESSESSDWVVAFQRSRGSIDPFLSGKQSQNRGSKLYIQMEYCSGKTLQEVIEDQPVNEANSFKMLKDILNGISYIHSRKTIHRDLKPSNLFIGSEGEVKLGDFGLASSVWIFEKKEVGNVGTPLYWSPEQETGKFGQKSDMYSIGIIFFEMWRKFGSYMQKAKEIRALAKDRTLPGDFNAPENVKSIIMWLTDSNPDSRPTAEELLQSSYLPHQIERKVFEEVLEVATRPNSSENEWLYEKIFKQANPQKIEFTFNQVQAINSMQNISRRKLKVDSMIKEAVEQKFREYFINAGAVEVRIPILYPYFTHFKIFLQGSDGKFKPFLVEHSSSIYKLIDRSGVVVQLPDNCVVPWARKVAKKEYGGIMKRFVIQSIYRTSGKREHPQEITQASLDFCYDPKIYDSRLKFCLQAEMLALSNLAVKDIFSDVLAIHGGFIEIHINDTRVLDYLFNYLEIKQEFRIQVLKILANIHKTNSKSLSVKLAECGLSPSIISKFEKLFRFQGKYLDVKNILEKTPLKKDKTLLQIIDQDFDIIWNTFETYGINNVYFNLGLISEDLHYYSGFVCSIVYKDFLLNTKSRKKEKMVLAYGGCYDNLISHYTLPSKSKESDISCFGIVFNIDLIVSVLIQTHKFNWIRGTMVFLNNQKLFEEEKLENEKSEEIKPNRISKIAENKINFTIELWKMGFSAIYNYNQMGEKMIADTCRRYKIRSCVDFGDGSNEKMSFTDYTSIKNQSYDLKKKDILTRLKAIYLDRTHQLYYESRHDIEELEE